MVATAPGFRADATTAVLNGVGAVHDFALPGTGVLHGTVSAPGTSGLPGAVVVATDGEGHVTGRTRTGTDGRWTLTGVPVGEVTVVASRRGFRPATAGVVVGSEPRHRRSRARPGRHRAGRHRPEPAGGPAVGAAVTATDSHGDVVATALPTPRAATSSRASNPAATRSRPPRSSRP